MTSLLFALVAHAQQSQVVAAVEGENVGVRAVRQAGAVHAEFLVRDRGRGFVVAAVSDGHPAAAASSVPLHFTDARETETAVVLSSGAFTATIQVPKTGGVMHFEVEGRAPRARLNGAMFGIVLAPVEKPTRAVFTFAPHGQAQFVTQDRLANPVALVAGSGYALAMMPDVRDLARNRPMNPVLRLDNDGRVSPGAFLAYGFASYARDENWVPKSAEHGLDNPDRFSWKFDLLVTTEHGAIREANDHLWARDGAERFRKPLPQTVPFRYYTRPSYDMERAGDSPGLWWVSDDPHAKMRAPKGADGQAKLTASGNLARFAYGMRWWGTTLQQYSWFESADEVMNFIASAPERSGFTAVAFDTVTKTWRFEPFDVSAVAQTARYKMKFAEAFDYTRRVEIIEQSQRDARRLLAQPLNGVSALFLQELSTSQVATDEELVSATKSHLASKRSELVSMAETYTRQSAAPSVETVSIALYLARIGEPAAANALLDRIFLRQALNRPETVSGTEVFGGFEGEHFIEESQSDYSADLLDAVLTLGRRDLAERAVAALRAPLALFGFPTHGISGMQLPDYARQMRSASWFGRNGLGEFGPWRGFAEGVGQTLTSFAMVSKKHGSMFTHKDGWTVGIDGIILRDGKPYSAFTHNPLSFEGVFPYEHVDASIEGRILASDPEDYPAIRALRLAQQDGELHVLALPGFTVINPREHLKGNFVLPGARPVPAEFLATGLGTRVTRIDLARGPVSFTGTLDDVPLSYPPTFLLAGPPAADLPWPAGWRRTLRLSDVIKASVTDGGVPVVSTGDDGRGSRDASLTGVIASQRFLLTENGLRFTLLGKAGSDLYVELVDPSTGATILSLQKNTDESEEFTWEIREWVGNEVVYRIVDTTKSGWIEVKDLRAVRVGP